MTSTSELNIIISLRGAGVEMKLFEGMRWEPVPQIIFRRRFTFLSLELVRHCSSLLHASEVRRRFLVK
ncbi:hypothetical protein A6F49_05835 [Enteractinococcus helveticum]|uniref:Uncharacterized protein n=1 Tax=Enteractinococcus helveticum TaxID=1837282 RepID=A0A1B7M242_9MICC|nr:hypothetical protein A6F49_05835 [Enteractinococcus helveticum]